MAYICEKYRNADTCKNCPHYRFDEDYGRMCCWAERDKRGKQANGK